MNRKSDEKILLELLLSGVSLTKKEFEAYTATEYSSGSTALAQRVYDLRQKGYDIKSKREPNNRGGYHTRYWMEVNEAVA